MKKLLDKRMLGGGLAMILVGASMLIYLNATVPVGTSGMSDEETIDLMKKQQENKDYSTLATMLTGVGFLLVLISFGARKRKGGTKKIEKTPPA